MCASLPGPGPVTGLTTWLGRSSQMARRRTALRQSRIRCTARTRASLGLRVAARQAARTKPQSKSRRSRVPLIGGSPAGGVVAGESLSVGRGRWAVGAVPATGLVLRFPYRFAFWRRGRNRAPRLQAAECYQHSAAFAYTPLRCGALCLSRSFHVAHHELPQRQVELP